MSQPLEDQRTTVYKVDPEHPANPSLPTLRTEEMMLNMGPQHPSTHGVLKVVLALEGERIVKATPVMGFLHRGVMTAFFSSLRVRLMLLAFFDELCGARPTTGWYRTGGVERDFTPDLVEKLRRFCDYFPPKLEEYVTFLNTNRIWLSRSEGVAVISAEDACNFGLSGPTLRGSGVDYDLRKFEPYAAYGECEWSVPVGKNGDTYDRYWVRVEEMRQSRNMVKQLLEKIPDGPVMADVPSVTLPPKDKVFNDLASMIQQFKLFSDGFQAPKGEIYCGTEAAKGELGVYIVSDGGGKPYRLKIRAPSFIHMGAFDYMARGYMIADIVTIFGTYDIVMGECDR